MDQRTSYTGTGINATFAPIIVSGRQFSRRLKKLNAGQRALTAYGLNVGELQLSSYTKPLSAAMARVSVSYLNTVAHASDAERQLLACGCLALSELHNKYRRPVTDADVERLIVEIGPDRIMSALDKITQPMMFGAAE